MDILRRIRRDGWQASFGILEHEEPVLAGYALAACDMLTESLKRSGMPPKMAMVVHGEIMTSQLVCIESMRQASRELWQDFLPGNETEGQ